MNPIIVSIFLSVIFFSILFEQARFASSFSAIFVNGGSNAAILFSLLLFLLILTKLTETAAKTIEMHDKTMLDRIYENNLGNVVDVIGMKSVKIVKLTQSERVTVTPKLSFSPISPGMKKVRELIPRSRTVGTTKLITKYVWSRLKVTVTTASLKFRP